MTVFAVVSIVFTWIFGILAFVMNDSLGQMAGLMLLPAMVIPFIMAYVCQRMTGAIGNPFKGLVWGPGSFFLLIWFLGMLLAILAVIVSIGLKFQQLDMEMTDYIAFMITQAKAQGYPAAPPSSYKISGWITVFGSPTIGAALGTAIMCLSFFPWLGWFGRRMMVFSKSNTVLVITAMFLLTGMAMGMVENPNAGEMSMVTRMLVTGLQYACYMPAVLWVFFKTRSVVLAALAQTAYATALAGCIPLLTSGPEMWTPPLGIIPSGVILLIGIAMWVIGDPGGEDLAVAAVAFDGTPLTPEQLRELDEHEAAKQTGVVPVEAIEPEPADPVKTE